MPDPTRPLSLWEAILVVNLYGNLAGIAALSLLVIGWWLPPDPIRVGVGLSASLGAFVLARWAASITRRLAVKRSIADSLLRRIQRRAYDPRLFRPACSDPCMRLLTRYLHRRLGRGAEAAEVIRRYRRSDTHFVQPGGPELLALVETGAVSQDMLEAAVRSARRASDDRNERRGAVARSAEQPADSVTMDRK